MSLGLGGPGSLEGGFLILKGSLPFGGVPGLFPVGGAFGMPTPGEGWGFPLVGAMGLGLPTIATNWGGPAGFLNAQNAFLLGFPMVGRGGGPPGGGPNSPGLPGGVLGVFCQTWRARSRARGGCPGVPPFFPPGGFGGRAGGLFAPLGCSVFPQGPLGRPQGGP
eukprot:UN3795